jgi:predicted small secreted protein
MTWWTAMRALIVCAGLAWPLALAACNTTEGFGRDVQSAGEAIEDTAEDAE